jgi:hypothetical protein
LKETETQTKKIQKMDIRPWETKDFGNISIIIEEKELRTHRDLLKIWSKYFKAMFENGMKESNESKINLEGDSFKDFSLVLALLYEPLKYKLFDNNVITVLRISDKYQFDQLKEHCESYLLKCKLNWEMSIELQKYPISNELRNVCNYWILSNIKILILRDDFNLLDKKLIILLFRSFLKNL